MNTQDKQYTEIINFKATPEMKEFQNQLRADGEILSIKLRNFVAGLMEEKKKQLSQQ